MRKFLLSLALAAVVAVPAVSSAAVNHETFGFTVNGQSGDDVRAGSSYKLGFIVDVDGGDDIDSFRVRHYNENGDIVNTQCVTVNPPLGSGDDLQVLRNVKTMSDMADESHDQEIHTFGLAGLGIGEPCDEDNQHPGSIYMQNRLLITHTSTLDDGDTTVGGGNSSTPVGAPSELSQVLAVMNQTNTLLAQLLAGMPAPSTKPAWCAQLSAKMVGTQYGQYSYANGQLQSFLIGQAGLGHIITYGATTYYGSQTMAAVAAAQNKCQ